MIPEPVFVVLSEDLQGDLVNLRQVARLALRSHGGGTMNSTLVATLAAGHDVVIFRGTLAEAREARKRIMQSYPVIQL